MIHLLLIHGWGLSHEMWQPFAHELQTINAQSQNDNDNDNNLNLQIHYASPYDNAKDSINTFKENYNKHTTKHTTKHSKKPKDKLIIIGHSLGGLKTLSTNIIAMADVIIMVNSFAKFTKSADFPHGINGKILSRMIKKFSQDPQSVLHDFLASNHILEHISNRDYMNTLDPKELLTGLEDLQNLDCRHMLNKKNIYNITGGSDPLINSHMQADTNNNPNIHNINYPTGEHFIPHTLSLDLAHDVTKIIHSISNGIVENFNNKAISYNNNAQIQKLISNKLIHYLNSYTEKNTKENTEEESTPIQILELGCGTGLFTDQLVENFPHAHVLSTDLSFNMLKHNQTRLVNNNKETHVRFDQINALTDMDKFANNSLDLICSSMLFQWFEDPIQVLKLWQAKLKPQGIFAISLLGDQSFENINSYIKEHNFTKIFNPYPPLSYFQNHGIDIYEDNCYFEYANLKSLLKTMINTGANHNKNDSKSNSELKTLLKEFNQPITIKWNSIFIIGRLEN